jgi:hypothetical protein
MGVDHEPELVREVWVGGVHVRNGSAEGPVEVGGVDGLELGEAVVGGGGDEWNSSGFKGLVLLVHFLVTRSSSDDGGHVLAVSVGVDLGSFDSSRGDAGQICNASAAVGVGVVAGEAVVLVDVSSDIEINSTFVQQLPNSSSWGGWLQRRVHVVVLVAQGDDPRDVGAVRVGLGEVSLEPVHHGLLGGGGLGPEGLRVPKDEVDVVLVVGIEHVGVAARVLSSVLSNAHETRLVVTARVEEKKETR